MSLSEEMKFNAENSNKYIKHGNQFTWTTQDEFECICDVISATAELGHKLIIIENKNLSNEAIERLRQEGFYVKEDRPFICISWGIK